MELESSAEPFRDGMPYELDANDTCRWLDDGRLFVETVSEQHGSYVSVTRLWLRFQPPDRPRVEMSRWNENVSWGSRSTRDLILGRAWVSSDGDGLGRSDGPDLTVDTEYTVRDSGSEVRRGRRLHLRTDQLAR